MNKQQKAEREHQAKINLWGTAILARSYAPYPLPCKHSFVPAKEEDVAWLRRMPNHNGRKLYQCIGVCHEWIAINE